MKTIPRGSRGFLSDERGTLYEIPLLIMAVVVAATVAFGQPTWGKGVLAALIAVLVLIAGFAALAGIGFLWGRIAEFPVVQRLAASGRLQACMDWAATILLALFLGAAGGFFGLVLSEIWFESPAVQLRAGLLAGLVLGAVPILRRLWVRRP